MTHNRHSTNKAMAHSATSMSVAPKPVERKLDYDVLGCCPVEVTVDSTGKPAQSLGPDLRATGCPEQPAIYRQWVRIQKLLSKQTRPNVTLEQLGRHSVTF